MKASTLPTKDESRFHYVVCWNAAEQVLRNLQAAIVISFASCAVATGTGQGTIVLPQCGHSPRGIQFLFGGNAKLKKLGSLVPHMHLVTAART